VKYPVLDVALVLMDSVGSDNATGAGNQQERLSIATIASDLGNFLAGFALGEGSFMIVCRRRADYRCGWKVSAAFNVSQNDIAPLELFRKTLGCGTIRIAGGTAAGISRSTTSGISRPQSFHSSAGSHW
jgi:LAGLIDADG endonuclease